MDPCLTQKIPISMPPWRKYSGAPKIKGYSKVTSLTPVLDTFFGKMPESEGQIQSDELFGRLVEFEGSGACLVESVAKKKRKAFCKVTHLLDPVRTIQSYYTDPTKGEKRMNEKLKNPMNQAFIDGLANYLLGQLRERKLSPHFCLFYGGFQGIAEKYRYNITSEFDSYRKYKAFWERRKAGIFTLHIEHDDSDMENESVDTPTSSLVSTDFHYSTPNSGSSLSSDRTHITLHNLEEAANSSLVELESVASLPNADEDRSRSNTGSGSDSDSNSEYTDDDSSELSVFIELKDYPVMLIFQEHMEGVLDDLLEEEEGAYDEKMWTAWTFQIIAALCAAQGALGFTHNDLHTNNIVWRKTDESWLFYKSRDGSVFRVPTFGKIFSIIDFGRAIFRVNETWFISDDYEIGGDAEGQYNFGTLQSRGKTTIYPNPSFDLCRYAVSIIDAIYPEMPTEVLEGVVLSKEDSWIIHETESPLWNLLWSWLIDENGRNVLYDEDKTERFPDFDLYQHISEHVKSAKPQDQIHKEIFKTYKISSKDVGDWETTYPLFC
uniref:Protein kinase domain-containing protein n=1 Tax=viral metagenome TaxID=1070528 RepID=A0A6C0KM85_9ZZZZ